MPYADRRWTVDDLATLPDDAARYEILDGELLVTPAPSLRHQRLVGALYHVIRTYLVQCPVGEVFVSPADVAFAPDTLLQPDLFVVPTAVSRLAKSWTDIRDLLLAIEVLSPGSMSDDRYRKRSRYQKERIPECWLVDGDARIVERWRPDDALPEVLRETLSWQPDASCPPLVIDLHALWREADGGWLPR